MKKAISRRGHHLRVSTAICRPKKDSSQLKLASFDDRYHDKLLEHAERPNASAGNQSRRDLELNAIFIVSLEGLKTTYEKPAEVVACL